MKDSPPIITLLTDFGESDGYVGSIKGVILSIVPGVNLVDISHQVAPQDVQQAALILSSAYVYFPAHTVHLVVVDPGVGGERRPVALQTSRGRFVAPDNGVLTYIDIDEQPPTAVLLENRKYWLNSPSYTFHGRDLFGPVAAHLARGVSIEKMGPPIDDLVRLPLPPLTIALPTIRGQISRVDRFGNLLTNVMHLSWVDDQTVRFKPLSVTSGKADTLDLEVGKISVICGWHTLKGLHQAYSQVGVGEGVALIGSSGELEIAINQGNASRQLALKVGDPVTVRIGQ